MSEDICGCHHLGEILAWSGWRPGTLLSTVKCLGRPHPREHSSPSVHSAEGETPHYATLPPRLK